MTMLNDWVKDKLDQFKDDPEFIKEGELLGLEEALIKIGAKREREKVVRLTRHFAKAQSLMFDPIDHKIGDALNKLADLIEKE